MSGVAVKHMIRESKNLISTGKKLMPTIFTIDKTHFPNCFLKNKIEVYVCKKLCTRLMWLKN